jgi:hypothetical protein
MKFKNRLYLKDRLGEFRIIKKFLWFPMELVNGKTYWLETARVIQCVQKINNGGHDLQIDAYRWINVGIEFDDETAFTTDFENNYYLNFCEENQTLKTSQKLVDKDVLP